MGQSPRVQAAKPLPGRQNSPLPTNTTEEEDSDVSEEIQLYVKRAEAAFEEHITLAKIFRLGNRNVLWKSKIGAYFIIMAYLCSYDTMVGFMLNCHVYGKSFVVCVVICMFVLGCPIVYLELVLGQYTSYGVYNVFSRIGPAFSGIGAVSLALNFVQMCSDTMTLPYFMRIFFSSLNIFGHEMPWHNCHLSYADPYCHDYNVQCEKLENRMKKLPKELIPHMYRRYGQMCFRSMMNHNDNVSDWKDTEIDQIQLQFSRSNPLLQVVVFLLIASFSALMSMLVFVLSSRMDVFFTTFLTKEFDAKYVKKNWTGLFFHSVITTFALLRLGQGGLIYFGAQTRFKNNAVVDAVVITSLSLVIPFIYSLAHMATIDSYFLMLFGNDVDRFMEFAERMTSPTKAYFYATGNNTVQFASYIQSMRIYGEVEPAAALLVSGACFFLSLANKIIRAEMITFGLLEIRPALSMFMGPKSRTVLLQAFLTLAFFCTLGFTTEAGPELMIGLQNITYPVLTACIVFSQLIAVAYCYGSYRLAVNGMAMSMCKCPWKRNHWLEGLSAITVSWIWRLMPTFVVGSLGIFLLKGYMEFYRASSDRRLNLDKDMWSTFALNTRSTSPTDINVILTVLGASTIVTIAALTTIKFYHRTKMFKAAFRPDPYLWGPRRTEDRQFGDEIEKKLRVR